MTVLFQREVTKVITNEIEGVKSELRSVKLELANNTAALRSESKLQFRMWRWGGCPREAAGPLHHNGSAIFIFPDYPPSVTRARSAFNDVFGDERERYGLLYPARLRITHNGKEKIFEDSAEATTYVEFLPSASHGRGPDLLLLSHSLVAASTGYFIHDFLDMALNQPLKKSWELLLHHSVVISCFSLAAASRLYVGFALVSLLVEINSVFLHTRQLLLLSGRRNRSGPEIPSPRPSLAFSITSWLNLGTFLVFRGFTLGWMSRWLACHSEHMPRYVLMMGTAGLTLISIMNAVLFRKLLRADILKNTSKSSNNH